MFGGVFKGLVSFVAADALVFKHQVIASSSTDSITVTS